MLDLGFTKIRLTGTQSRGDRVLEFQREKNYWSDLEYWMLGFFECKDCKFRIKTGGMPESGHMLESDVAVFRAMMEADLSQLVEDA